MMRRILSCCVLVALTASVGLSQTAYSQIEDWTMARFFDDLDAATRLYSFQRRMVAWLLGDRRPSDSICLLLPWDDERNFLVPTADPANPVFETIARGAVADAFRDTVAHGTGVVGVSYSRGDVSITQIKHDDFCAVSVQEKKR